MKNRLFNLLTFCCAAAIIASCNNPSAVNIQIDEIFTNHAVLQRDAEVPVWGTADPGGMVKVDVGDASALAEVDETLILMNPPSYAMINPLIPYSIK